MHGCLANAIGHDPNRPERIRIVSREERAGAGVISGNDRLLHGHRLDNGKAPAFSPCREHKAVARLNEAAHSLL